MTETDRHRALMVLASCADGLTEALLTAGHHFTRDAIKRNYTQFGVARGAGRHDQQDATTSNEPYSGVDVSEADLLLDNSA
jgi:hypothetical protein